MISNPSDEVLVARLTTKWLEDNTAGNASPTVLPSEPVPPKQKEPINDRTPDRLEEIRQEHKAFLSDLEVAAVKGLVDGNWDEVESCHEGV